MKKKRFLFSLLMAIVMMAMSPQKMWAQATIYYYGAQGGTYTIFQEGCVNVTATSNDYATTVMAEVGSTVTLTPNPSSGNAFGGFSVIDFESGSYLDLTQNGNSYSFTMPSSGVFVRVTFIKAYSISSSAFQHGSFTSIKDNASNDITSAQEGTTVWVTVAADEGYHMYDFSAKYFDEDWYTDRDIELSYDPQNHNRASFTMPKGNVTLSAQTDVHYYTSCSWEWADDGSEATVTFPCYNDYCSHSFSLNTKTTPAVTITPGATTATCTSAGKTTLNASVTYNGTQYNAPAKEVETAALGHVFTSETEADAYLKTAATCTNDAVYYHKCAGCDLSSLDNTNSTWTKTGSAGHSFNKTSDPGHTFCTACNHTFFRYTATSRVVPSYKDEWFNSADNLKDANGNSIYVDSQNTWDATTGEGVMEFNTPLVTIGLCAFRGCSGLSGSLIIPNSVVFIGSYAFEGCSRLSGSLTIPNSVECIGQCAFRGCSGLSGPLTIPNSVVIIEDYAFDGCSRLSGSLTIPNSVEHIGKGAFYGCSGFSGSLTIGSSVNCIDNQAFYQCSKLTSVEMKTVPYVGENAFTSVTDNKTLVLSEDSYIYSGGKPNSHVLSFGTSDHPTFKSITYSRTFTGTNWTTWYVPFDLTLTDEICAKYDFSRINNVHQYEDENGEVDKTVIESFRLKSGATLKANYPYLIRAKSDADKSMTLTLQNVKPVAKEDSVFCQSVDTRYIFTGTYKAMGDGTNASTDYSLFDDDEYGWEHFYKLKPQRHYLTITSRNGSSSANKAPRRIELKVVGEEDATGIESLTPALSQGEGVGKYLENGKVVIIRNGKKYNTNGQVMK